MPDPSTPSHPRASERPPGSMPTTATPSPPSLASQPPVVVFQRETLAHADRRDEELLKQVADVVSRTPKIPPHQAAQLKLARSRPLPTVWSFPDLEQLLALYESHLRVETEFSQSHFAPHIVRFKLWLPQSARPAQFDLCHRIRPDPSQTLPEWCVRHTARQEKILPTVVLTTHDFVQTTIYEAPSSSVEDSGNTGHGDAGGDVIVRRASMRPRLSPPREETFDEPAGPYEIPRHVYSPMWRQAVLARDK